jgi:hypothetical protein
MGDVPVEITLVHAVDRYQQNVFGLMRHGRTSWMSVGGQNRQRAERCG